MTTKDPDTPSVNTIRGLEQVKRAFHTLKAENELPRTVKARVAIERASTLGCDRYVGDSGAVVGMHTFGGSAPLRELLTKFGFTPGQVSQAARERVAAAGHVAGAAGKDST